MDSGKRALITHDKGRLKQRTHHLDYLNCDRLGIREGHKHLASERDLHRWLEEYGIEPSLELQMDAAGLDSWSEAEVDHEPSARKAILS